MKLPRNHAVRAWLIHQLMRRRLECTVRTAADTAVAKTTAIAKITSEPVGKQKGQVPAGPVGEPAKNSDINGAFASFEVIDASPQLSSIV